MKHLLSLCTLMAATALQGPAQTTVETGQPYTLQASSQSVYLSNDGKQLRTVASIDDEPYYRTVFYFEASDAADGTYHLMTPTGKYVWKQLDGTANIMLGAKSQSSTGEELSSPCAFTIKANGANLLLQDVSTGLYFNMYVNNNGAALHSGSGDASQWKIFRVEDNESVTSVEEGVEYYLQTQMNAKVGQYAYQTTSGTIQVSATTSEASVFTFISDGQGAWYLHNVSANTEVAQGAQGTLLKMERTTAQATLQLAAESFTAAATADGMTLQGSDGSYLVYNAATGTVAYAAEATTWDVQPYDGEAPMLSAPLPDTYYNITWAPTPSSYMSEEANGALVVSPYDVTVRCFWEFIPTDNDRCYYIRNTATGNYIQSCRGAQSPTNTITTGPDPVEYYVGTNNGQFYFSSTDCTNYNNASQNPNGLNKDGASSNIIAWGAHPNNTGSYWNLVETENLYEVRPFTPCDELGKTDFTYTLVAGSGLALQSSGEGTLSWAEKTEANEQAWYFVGEGNVSGGYLIANVKNPTHTINASADGLSVGESEAPTRWYVVETYVEGVPFYSFRPFASKDEAGSELTVDGVSLVQVRAIRSSFSTSAQIYQMPCGSLGDVYVSRASISGEGVLTPLAYPLSTLNGGGITEESTKPSTWFTLFTHSKPVVAIGKSFDLHLNLSGEPTDMDEVYVYFDWNRDGVFETTVKMDAAREMTATIDVPADAKAGKSRVRVRLTNNGLSDPEDDAAGQIIDFVFNAETAGDTYTVTAVPNDAERGTVTLSPEGGSQTAGTAMTASITRKGNSDFVCWREGNNVLSVDEVYTFTVDHNTHLVACFSPNSYATLGMDDDLVAGQNVLVTIAPGQEKIDIVTDAKVHRVLLYTTGGQLMIQTDERQLDTSNLTAGTYIVKVYTDKADASAKVLVK